MKGTPGAFPQAFKIPSTVSLSNQYPISTRLTTLITHLYAYLASSLSLRPDAPSYTTHLAATGTKTIFYCGHIQYSLFIICSDIPSHFQPFSCLTRTVTQSRPSFRCWSGILNLSSNHILNNLCFRTPRGRCLQALPNKDRMDRHTSCSSPIQISRESNPKSRRTLVKSDPIQLPKSQKHDSTKLYPNCLTWNSASQRRSSSSPTVARPATFDGSATWL